MIRIVFFAAALLFAASASAQGYPNKPIRMVVPWPSGQATDLVGRLMAQKLSELLGQPIVVDNKPGAGGTIGTDNALQAADTRERLAGIGLEIISWGTDEFAAYLKGESTRFASIIKNGNIKLEQ